MTTPAAALLLAFALAAAARAGPVECSTARTQLIPLPIYSTLPNEGSTFGFLPVFLGVCQPQGRTFSIIAPSVSWNDVIHATGTLRVYRYPSDDETLTFIASASTRINSNVLLLWRDLPRSVGAVTREVELRWERSAFYRFFGLGPETPAGAETSYTRIRAHANARAGLNIGGAWNLGLALYVHRDDVQDLGVPGLPLSRRVFPTVPGMTGATTVGEVLDLRYEGRPQAEYSRDGFFAGIAAGPVEGIQGAPAFLRGGARLRLLHPEAAWLTAAARLDATFVSTERAPFYDQSPLGGAFLLRGFTENRFFDRNSWLIEMEQRIRVFETHLFGVTADWRVDPFIAAGQVYGPLHQSFSHPRPVAGVGFRAFVHPNVLGRIDVASGGEGVKVYVELGYPY